MMKTIVLALALGPAVVAAAPEPQTSMVTVAPGEALRVTTLGAGKPVVLLPGLFGSAYGFRKVMPLLADAGWHAVVIEPLGVGDSARPPRADYSLTAQADRLEAALDALGIDGAVVVAHSVGASIALRLACRHPRRVAALVSLEGGPAETAVTASFRRALALAPLLKLFGRGVVVRKIRGQLEDRSFDPRWVTDEVVAGYTRGAAADLGATLTALERMADSREPEALAPRLSELRCPVRLVLGAAPHGGGPSARDVETLSRNVAQLQQDRVPEAGHFLFEEAPAAVVAAIARAAEQIGEERYAQAGGGR